MFSTLINSSNAGEGIFRLWESIPLWSLPRKYITILQAILSQSSSRKLCQKIDQYIVRCHYNPVDFSLNSLQQAPHSSPIKARYWVPFLVGWNFDSYSALSSTMYMQHHVIIDHIITAPEKKITPLFLIVLQMFLLEWTKVSPVLLISVDSCLS